MRLRRYLCLVLLCAVICFGLFSVSTYAAVVEQYSYNDIVLPQIPDEYDGKTNKTLFRTATGSYIVEYKDNMFTSNTCKADGSKWLSGSGYLTLENGAWVRFTSGVNGNVVWSNIPVMSGDTVFMAASEPVFSIIEIPDPPKPVGVSDLSSLLDVFNGQLNIQTVVGVLAGAAGVSVGLVFLWWGVRKVTSALIKAFKKGKLRI